MCRRQHQKCFFFGKKPLIPASSTLESARAWEPTDLMTARKLGAGEEEGFSGTATKSCCALVSRASISLRLLSTLLKGRKVKIPQLFRGNVLGINSSDSQGVRESAPKTRRYSLSLKSAWKWVSKRFFFSPFS